MIRYKVVGDSRKSCYAGGKYNLEYHVGEIVKADIKTHGIMVFKDYYSAAKFLREHRYCCSYVLKVMPFGRAKKVRKISKNISEHQLNRYYKTNKLFDPMPPPPGTLCYHAVEVLT